MTSILSPTCPTHSEPDCSRRLLLGDCLEIWKRETQPGVVNTGRYRCRYVSWGRGPTIVLIPGMAMDALGFVMLITRLQPHFQCISYDLPDGNLDGANLMRYRHTDFAADLFALLDHLGIQQCYLLGSSFGSTIALSAMRAQPDRFPRAILQGSFARRPLALAEVLAASFARFLPGRLEHLPLVRRILDNNVGAEFRQREPDVWDFFVAQNLQFPLRAFASRALMIHRLDLRGILPAIQRPVLLVYGDHDRLVGKTCEQELKQGLQYAARAEIEQCGHFPQLTHPEVLAEVVRQYLLSGE